MVRYRWVAGSFPLGALLVTTVLLSGLLAVGTPLSAAAQVTLCGRLVAGVECVLFQADRRLPFFGALFLLSDSGGFRVGDAICVTGIPHPCGSICQQGNGCFDVATIEAAPAPTPTPTPFGSVIPCCGDADGDGVVSDGEVQGCIGIRIPEEPIPAYCACNGSFPSAGDITLILSNHLNGCPGTTPRTSTPTPTPTLPPAPKPTPMSPPVLCVGDCDRSGDVVVSELITGIDIALGVLPVTACSAFGFNEDEAAQSFVPQLLQAVNNALHGCRTTTPTPSSTPSQSPTCVPGPFPMRTCFYYEYYVCAASRNGCQVCGCCFEFVGGCCSFGGSRPCFPLIAGQDAGRCRNSGGWPTGCPVRSLCNTSTGQCEQQ